jgi:hypothetical protein
MSRKSEYYILYFFHLERITEDAEPENQNNLNIDNSEKFFCA